MLYTTMKKECQHLEIEVTEDSKVCAGCGKVFFDGYFLLDYVGECHGRPMHEYVWQEG